MRDGSEVGVVVGVVTESWRWTVVHQRTSRYEGDLVAKCYYAKRKLVWEVLDSGLKSKVEIQWSDISAMKATCPDNLPGSLEIEVRLMAGSAVELVWLSEALGQEGMDLALTLVCLFAGFSASIVFQGDEPAATEAHSVAGYDGFHGGTGERMQVSSCPV